jgi:hypothetical protein
MCGGIVEEQPQVMDRDLAHIIGGGLCADELMIIFRSGLDPRAAPGREGVLWLLAEYMGLAERLARRARQRGAAATAAELQRRARDAEQRARQARGQYMT